MFPSTNPMIVAACVFEKRFRHAIFLCRNSMTSLFSRVAVKRWPFELTKPYATHLDNNNQQSQTCKLIHWISFKRIENNKWIHMTTMYKHFQVWGWTKRTPFFWPRSSFPTLRPIYVVHSQNRSHCSKDNVPMCCWFKSLIPIDPFLHPQISCEWRTKLLTTRNGRGQSGWSPIGCESLYFHAMCKHSVSVSGWPPIGCEGFHTKLNIPSPLPTTSVFH
jgi:hypothetical protein